MDKLKYKMPLLNQDGSEIVDTTPVAMPVSRFQSSNDMDFKLKQMVDKVLEERRPISEDEILGDEIDWDLPDDRPINRYVDKMPTRSELNNAFKKFSRKKKQAESDDDSDPSDIPQGRNVRTGEAARKKQLAKNKNKQSESEEDSDE